MKNIKISKQQMAFIRELDDFDIRRFLSEIHDHGWPTAAQTLSIIARLDRYKDSKPGQKIKMVMKNEKV